MHFDLAQLAPSDAYKLLVSTVVPRPIALVTTVDGEGRIGEELRSDREDAPDRPHARPRPYARTTDLFLMDRLGLDTWDADRH